MLVDGCGIDSKEELSERPPSGHSEARSMEILIDGCVVFDVHQQVKVVVPRRSASMPIGAKRRARIEEVGATKLSSPDAIKLEQCISKNAVVSRWKRQFLRFEEKVIGERAKKVSFVIRK